MNVSIHTSFLTGLAADEMVKVYARRGWRTLDFAEEHTHEMLGRGDPVRVGESFHAYAADHGITFPQAHLQMTATGAWSVARGDTPWGFDLACGEDAVFEKRLEDLSRWVDLYAALGVKAAVHHHGGFSLAQDGWSDDRVLVLRRAGIDRLCEYARGTGMKICVENLPDYSPSYDHLRPLAEFLSRDLLGVCLDTGHAAAGRADCAAFVRNAGGRLAALHVHDHVAGRDHILPYSHGAIDWPSFLQTLRESRYNGPFSFELSSENNCPRDVQFLKLDYALNLGRFMTSAIGIRS